MKRDSATLDRRVEELLARCREEGLNITPQRVAIYRALLESTDHPSPEMLYRRVLPAMPSLSLATVYKVLDALARLGVVQEVPVPNDPRRFDANMERHHHVVCSRCKRSEEH